ncbi:hypothetical protein BDV95DRAFT_594780 [Massariosphaeria phaeospora]|uniref:Uncharacterized protein n=1 Tax=Massariosphaeria phaeospora TaxID=100035 RepID=A0A7C8I620_9PLEO|nr:hypothetical protein BDV95DRAFT_594780 [Massariosphaeria phaeospora]
MAPALGRVRVWCGVLVFSSQAGKRTGQFLQGEKVLEYSRTGREDECCCIEILSSVPPPPPAALATTTQRDSETTRQGLKAWRGRRRRIRRTVDGAVCCETPPRPQMHRYTLLQKPSAYLRETPNEQNSKVILNPNRRSTIPVRGRAAQPVANPQPFLVGTREREKKGYTQASKSIVISPPASAPVSALKKARPAAKHTLEESPSPSTPTERERQLRVDTLIRRLLRAVYGIGQG